MKRFSWKHCLRTHVNLGRKIAGSSRICGKMRVDGNQTILVWHALASRRRHIRDMGPELEALVTFTAPHKSATNQIAWDFKIEWRKDCSIENE